MPDNHCLSPDSCLLGAYASFPFRRLEHRSDSKNTTINIKKDKCKSYWKGMILKCVLIFDSICRNLCLSEHMTNLNLKC